MKIKALFISYLAIWGMTTCGALDTISLDELKNYSYSSVQKLFGSSLSLHTATFKHLSSSGNYPDFLNFNIGNTGSMGFSFFNCAWSKGSCNAPIIQDRDKIFDSINWANGVGLLLIGVDEHNKIITDLTILNGSNNLKISFELLIYDAATQAYMGSIPVPYSSMQQTPTSWQNRIALGINSGPDNQIIASYPAIFVVTGPANQSMSISRFPITSIENKPYGVLQKALGARLTLKTTKFNALSSKGNYPDSVYFNIAEYSHYPCPDRPFCQNQKINKKLIISSAESSQNFKRELSDPCPGELGCQKQKSIAHGFSLFGCAWQQDQCFYRTIKDMNHIFDLANWEHGLYLVLLAVDDNNYVIINLDDVQPYKTELSFVLCVYDSVSHAYIGSIPLPIPFMSQIPTTWNNQLEMGIAHGSTVKSIYPTNFCVKGPGPK